MTQENLAQSLEFHGLWRVAWPLVSPIWAFQPWLLSGKTAIPTPLFLFKTAA
jgi:hypothetical protein